MLEANVLAALMQAYVTEAIPEFAMTDDTYAGGKNEFFKAISRAVVDHIHSSAVVIVPGHIVAPDPQGVGDELLDGGTHEPGNII